MNLTAEQQARKTAIQRELISLRRQSQAYFISNKQLRDNDARWQTLVTELLAIDPDAATYPRFRAGVY